MSPSAPKILVPRSLGEPFWYAGETSPPGGRGPAEIVLVRTNAEKGRWPGIWSSEIVLVRTDAEKDRWPGILQTNPQRLSSWGQTLRIGRQPLTLDPPRTLSQRMSSWGQTLRDPPRGEGVPRESNPIILWSNPYTPSWTRFSNGLADNRSKVSVKKSQIGFVVINFSRSIFPCMSNIYENG